MSIKHLEYTCWDDRGRGREDARIVHAVSPSYAAETYAEKEAWGDPWIDGIVYVSYDDRIYRYHVYSETSVEYKARKIS